MPFDFGSSTFSPSIHVPSGVLTIYFPRWTFPAFRFPIVTFILFLLWLRLLQLSGDLGVPVEVALGVEA